MTLAGACRHCGDKCEWDKDDTTGVVSPAYPCARSPTGSCEPHDPGSKMVADIGRRSGLAASRRARGFGGKSKRR